MPRLRDVDYLKQRRRLRVDWQHGGSAFGNLSSLEQYVLHDYFAPAEDLSDVEALDHRLFITMERRSLPQMAGRAFRAIEPFLWDESRRPEAMAPRVTIPPSRRQVVVYGIVRPKPDLEKLARAAVELAKELVRQEDAAKRKAQTKDDDTKAA